MSACFRLGTHCNCWRSWHFSLWDEKQGEYLAEFQRVNSTCKQGGGVLFPSKKTLAQYSGLVGGLALIHACWGSWHCSLWVEKQGEYLAKFQRVNSICKLLFPTKNNLALIYGGDDIYPASPPMQAGCTTKPSRVLVGTLSCTEKMALALYSGGLKYHAFPGITGISLKKELDLKLVLSCILKSKIGHPDEMNI